MGKNLFSKLAISNKPHKGSFDLSYRHILSCEFGQLIPFDIREVVPSDHFKLSTTSFTRTKPLVSAAYSRFREHIDYYFVPYRLLWRFSDSLFTSTPVNNSAVSSNPSTVSVETTSVPYLSVADIKAALNVLSTMQGTTAAPYYIIDDGGLQSHTTTCQLLSLLGYGDWNRNHPSSSSPNLSVFRLLAYQKIYQDFYRNDQWEELCPQAFNVDYLLPSNTHVPLSDMVKNDYHHVFAYSSFLAMKYANFPKDIFTGVLPKAQYGATAYVDMTADLITGSSRITLPAISNNDTKSYGVAIKALSSGSSNYQFGHIDIDSDESISALAQTTLLPHTKTGSFSVLDLRYAQAIQKYREITQSHKLNYKSQIQAHFDINVSDDRSDMCKYLGGRVSDFKLNEVTNTNITSDNVATMVANSQARTNCEIDFTAREHGIIMGIYYVEPLLDYDTHFSLFNFKLNRDDFFKPEFDNLGFQPANIFGLADQEFASNYFDYNKTPTCGYLPRYYEYKLPQDTIDSSASMSFPQWVAPVRFQDLFVGIYNNDVLSVNYRCFKIKPSLLNNIFSAQISDSSSTESYRLLTCFSNNAVAVRPMSESGLPY